jgi:peptidyl-prolyl cis-trans isomerase C
MALKVNGEGITLAEYQAELNRMQQADSAAGSNATPQEQHDRLIKDMTEQLLLAQAAATAGYVVDDAALQAKIDSIATKMGGMDKLQTWESTNGYTDESFRKALRREMAVTWEKDQIVNSVATTADQVHARQILVQDEGNANSYYQQLQNGADFATLAYTLDQTTGGDLGWFPQWFATQPEIGAAAFALEPGQYSTVIKTLLGYHIIFVIERDANHPLSVEARHELQQKTLDEWLQTSKAAATIEVLV